jgi:two-component system, LuxR family, sensor kinase FixL
MPEDFRKSANRHVGEIKSINRDLIEKALSMRCHAYLSQVKSQLLSQTIFELDRSKKVIVKHRDRLHTLVEERTAELQRSNNDLLLFNEVVKNIAEGVYLVGTKDLTILYANPKFLKMFGYSAEEIIGQHVSIINAPSKNDPVGTAKEIARALEQKGFWEGEVLNIKKNGEKFYCHVVISSFFHKLYGEVYISLQSDISGRKKDEQELQRINKELCRSNDELENFTSVASHDLKEPVRKIITFGDRLIETEANLSSKGKNYVERMQKSCLRMNNLVDGMLDYSRVSKKNKQLEPIDLRKIVNGVLFDLDSKIKSNQARVNIFSLPTVEADPSQMHQLFQNLISNALKYRREGIAPVINLTSSRNANGAWEILVEDNGIGFDEKYKNRIFKMFERLHGKSEFEGTGIGLAVCKKIVTRHNGTIVAESLADKGATFIITLPESQPRED